MGKGFKDLKIEIDDKQHSGEKYISARNKEYKTIVISIVAALIIIVVGAVILANVLKKPKQELKLYDQNGQYIEIFDQEKDYIPTKISGYQFEGWADDSGKIYATPQEAYNAGATKIKQVWDTIEYKLVLYTNGGTILSEEYEKGEDSRGEYYVKIINVETETFLLPSSKSAYYKTDIITKEGNAFKFWSQIPNSDDWGLAKTEIIKGQTTNLVLYANWNPTPARLIVYGRENEKLYGNLINQGQPIEKTWLDPQLDGYTFDGYYEDEAREVEFDFEKVQNAQEVKIYTKWKANNYTITYMEKNGNVISVDNLSGILNETDLSNYTPNAGYEFDGWATKKGNEYKLFNVKDFKYENITLYPLTSEIIYKVHWKVGEDIVCITEYKYNNIPSPEAAYETPTKQKTQEYSYEFIGWENEVTHTGITAVGLNKEETYIAKFDAKKNTYKYCFINEDETIFQAEQEAEYGTKIESPTTKPTKASTKQYAYEFAGWIYGETNKLDENFELQEDVVFKPSFNETTRKYIVTWYYKNPLDNGIVKIYSEEVDYGTKISDLEYESSKNDNNIEIPESIEAGNKTYNLDSSWEGQDGDIIENNLNLYTKYNAVGHIYTYYICKNNGSEKIKNTQFVGDPISLPIDDPLKDDEFYDYTFQDWYLDVNKNETWDEGDTTVITSEYGTDIEKDAVIYIVAKYTTTPKEYRISFKDCNKTEMVVPYGENLSIEAPTKTGYDFEYWMDENKNEYTFEATMPAYDIVVYAKWAAKPVVVSYSLNYAGASSVETTIDATYDESYGELLTATRVGYNFEGWYLNSECTGEVVTKDTIVKTAYNHTLYAKWEAKSVVVSYSLNYADAPSVETTIDATYDCKYGELLTPARVGYTFSGWYLNEDCSSDKVESTTVVKNEEDHTLYAKWEAKSVVVSYSLNYADAPLVETTIDTAYDESYGDLLNPDERVGYTFSGWYLNEDCSSDKVESTTVIKNEENHTLYAKWTAKSVVVSYSLNYTDAPSVGTTIDATYDESYGELLTATRVGYNFEGWYLNSECTGEVVTKDTIVKTAYNHTLYAKWTAKSVVVSYSLNYTDAPSIGTTINAAYDSTYGELLNPDERVGYTFSGWYLNEDCSSDKVESTTVVKNEEDHTLYAKWTAKSVVVSYSLNYAGASSVETTIDATYDESYGELLTATRVGYNFEGWYLNSECTGEVVTKDTIVKTAYNHTLYAKWTAKPVVVSYSLNYADAPLVETTIDATYDESYGELLTATRVGYNFEGWYLNSECTGEVVTKDTIVKTEDNHTLYAKWTAKSVVVSYSLNYAGASSVGTTIDTAYDSTYGELLNPDERVGYTFSGWYLNEDCSSDKVESTTVVKNEEDHTLYAKWTAIEYTITFHYPSVMQKQDTTATYTIETGYEFNRDGEIDGFELDNWYSENYLSIVDNINIGNYGHIDVYGNYYSKQLTIELKGEVYSVTKFNTTDEIETVYIPKMYNGKRITEIASRAFTSKKIKNVIMNDIITINARAFSYSNIETIQVQSLQSIGESAFASSKLKEIEANNVTTIGGSAFDGCIDLISAIFINVESIGDYAFAGTSSLQSITISNKLTTLEEYAFVDSTIQTVNYYGTQEELNALINNLVNNDEFIDATKNYLTE